MLPLSAMSSMNSRLASCISAFAVLRDVFQFHPFALEDSEHFGQREKLDDYDDFVFLVLTCESRTFRERFQSGAAMVSRSAKEDVASTQAWPRFFGPTTPRPLICINGCGQRRNQRL